MKNRPVNLLPLLAPCCLLLCAGAASAAEEGKGGDDAFRQTVSALAGKLAGAGAKRLAVIEFANASGDEARLGGSTGAAGKYLAEIAEAVLAGWHQPGFEIIDRQRCSAVMQEIEFQVAALGNRELLARYGGLQPVDALVTGSIRRAGDRVKVAVRAVAVPEATVRGLELVDLPLSPDLAALFGDSFYLPPLVGERARALADLPEPEIESAMTRAVVERVVAAVDEHPLADAFSGVPYRVDICVDDKPLPFRREGKDLFVTAAMGKPYQIRLANRSERAVAVAVYVDGLNTISGARDLPSQGLKWVLKPGTEASLRGWQKGAETARAFVFTSAANSLAARQKYTDEIGLITTVWFPEKVRDQFIAKETRGISGTGEGEEIGVLVTRVKLEYEKTPAAVLSLRYDAPQAMEALEVVE